MLKNLKNNLKSWSWFYQCLSRYRSWQQDRKAIFELTYYQSEASKKGFIIPEGEKLTVLLRERLKQRGISPQPKEKGELHIFLTYYISNWEAVLPKVLSRFGKVTEFEWRNRGFNDVAPDWLKYRGQMNNEMLNMFYNANSEQSIDIVVGYLSGYNTDPGVLQKMGEAGAVIFNFCWDDKLNFRGGKLGGRWSGPAALAWVVDLNLTNAPDARLKYFMEGGLSMFWPEAADPDMHRPYDLPFEYDVSFVGQRYGQRPKFINDLKKLGINVVTFGRGWENGVLSDEEMVKLYSRSKVNLGFANIGYSMKFMCLKGRDFEIPMSGGLYLTQDNPELSLVYEVGKEIVTYRDVEDCARKIKYFIEHPQEAEKIRKAGRERALRDHTWEKRFEQIFSIAGLLKNSGPQVNE